MNDPRNDLRQCLEGDVNDVLQRLGYNSRPLRIEAAVFPDDRKFYGSILGSWREPGPRRVASPDMWKGHLAVTSLETNHRSRKPAYTPVN